MQKAAISLASKARGDRVRRWYSDEMTGATLKRPELERLRAEVRAGAVSKLYVWRLDRLTRSGIRDTLALVEELESNGCELVTVADAFDFRGPARDVVLAVLAWAAQVERTAIGDRIRAARERVEAKGGRWGRPTRVSRNELAKARELAEAGHSIRVISARLRVPKSTLARALLPHKK